MDIKTKHSKIKKSGNTLTRLSSWLDELDNKQVKYISHSDTSKRIAMDEQEPGMLLFIAIVAVLFLPSFTSLGPALTVFILVMFWPLTIPATIAIAVLARRKQYRAATGVVVGIAVLCAFAIFIIGV